MKIIKNLIMAGTLLLAVSPLAAAQERVFSYPAEGAPVQYFGDSKAQTYDIAIRLSDPVLVGKQVTGVSVALCEGATVSDPKGWLSSDLLIDAKKNNAPDIAIIDATVDADNVLTATFAEPYTVTSDGVYVGYSVTIAKATTFGDQNPNPVAACVNTEGAYIHSTRTNKKWTSLSSYNVASCMEVSLSGDFPADAVAVSQVAPVRVEESAETFNLPLTLANYGEGAVNDVTLAIALNDGEAVGNEVVQTVQLPAPLSSKFGSSVKVSVELPAYNVSGRLAAKVLKVNGKENGMGSYLAYGEYTLMNFVPVARPLMEEYTGLWCGWCPRGWVAMELMTELYGDDFVCVSYHSGDEMEYIAATPNTPQGYPSAFMNRSIDADPYYGLANDGFGIRDLWLNLRDEVPEANIAVSLRWADEAKGKIVCTSTVKFIGDVAGDDYRVDYILVGDGFKSYTVYDADGKVDSEASVTLTQSNNYSGSEPLDDSPLWTDIVEGGSRLRNMVFNDVAMAKSPSDGVKAFPAEVKANEEYSFDYEFDYTAIRNVEGLPNILPADGEIRCVAVLRKADGTFVNSNKSQAIGASSSVRDITGAGAAVVSTEWYDLQGRRLKEAPQGVGIRVERLSDGTVRSGKRL